MSAEGKKIDFSKLVKDIHMNALTHGWWDTARPESETIALIHSEWSEALEAHRAGEGLMFTKESVWPVGSEKAPTKEKPEGIAVELIDGCIRIYDYAQHKGIPINDPFDDSPWPIDVSEIPYGSFPKMIADLHWLTTNVYRSAYGFHDPCNEAKATYLSAIIRIVFLWCTRQGIDPLVVMKWKHEYNVTRPYKHGKRY